MDGDRGVIEVREDITNNDRTIAAPEHKAVKATILEGVIRNDGIRVLLSTALLVESVDTLVAVLKDVVRNNYTMVVRAEENRAATLIVVTVFVLRRSASI